jgi:hypothetical protein
VRCGSIEIGAADDRIGCCGEPDSVSLRLDGVTGPKCGAGKLGLRSLSLAGGEGLGTERIDWVDEAA